MISHFTFILPAGWIIFKVVYMWGISEVSTSKLMYAVLRVANIEAAECYVRISTGTMMTTLSFHVDAGLLLGGFMILSEAMFIYNPVPIYDTVLEIIHFKIVMHWSMCKRDSTYMTRKFVALYWCIIILLYDKEMLKQIHESKIKRISITD